MPPKSASPPEKMSLRTSIKQPKRHSGEGYEESSICIMGDRIVHSSETDDTSPPIKAPAIKRTSKTSISPASSLGTATAEKTFPMKKEAIKGPAAKKAAARKEASRAPSPSYSGYGHRQMEFWDGPLNVYFGPQTEFNPTLPPAAFPTLDTEEQRREWAKKQAVFAAPKSPALPISNTHIQVQIPSRHHVLQNRPQSPTVVNEVFASLSRQPQEGLNSKMRSGDTVPEETHVPTEEQRHEVWNELSDYYKLVILDSMCTEYDEANVIQIMSRLRLDKTQQDHATALLSERQDRKEQEDRTQTEFNALIGDHMIFKHISLTGKRLKAMQDSTIYKHVGQTDHLVTKVSDLQMAKWYLSICGFRRSLLITDDLPPIPRPKTQVQLQPQTQFQQVVSLAQLEGLQNAALPAEASRPSSNPPENSSPTKAIRHGPQSSNNGAARIWRTGIPPPGTDETNATASAKRLAEEDMGQVQKKPVGRPRNDTSARFSFPQSTGYQSRSFKPKAYTTASLASPQIGTSASATLGPNTWGDDNGALVPRQNTSTQDMNFEQWAGERRGSPEAIDDLRDDL